ncbi:MAG: hypothetical protein VX899_17700 [Myxococcota bacterium]|nr:hypothetical protein [Myxococcota bacterium]
MSLLLLLSCTGTLSNDPFVEDALFLSALPDPTLLELAWPVDTVDADPRAELLLMSLDSLNTGAAQTAFVLSLTNTISAVPPSERGEHHRVWGPGAWDDNPGSFLRVEMTRTSDRENYLYTFQAGSTSDGPWVEFFEGGAALSTEPDAPLADGTMFWDAAALDTVIPDHGAQDMLLRYQHGADGTLSLEMEAAFLLEVEQRADGSGWLSAALQEDVDAESGQGVEEDLGLESTWLHTGQGRGALSISGGDLPIDEATLTQCWSANGATVWSAGEPSEWFEPSGAEGDCAL